MKIIRHSLGFVMYVIVFFAVTGLVAAAVHTLIGGPKIFGMYWATIPASVVGVVAAHPVYRVISGTRFERK